MRHLAYRRTIVVAAALAGLLPVTAASAATTVSTANASLDIMAAAGEHNSVSLTVSGASYKVRDGGDTIAAGSGCMAVDAHTAVCAAAGLFRTTIDVGDLSDSVVKDAWSLGGRIHGGSGDDKLSAGPANWGNGLFGGPGDDSLIGGANSEYLEGGPGADVLSGGPGFDGVSYENHLVPVTVTIDGVADDGAAGEGDDVRLDVEALYGGPEDDTLVGSSADNRLSGRAGSDRLAGGDGHDTLTGGGGDDRLLGQAGNDSFPAAKYPDGADELNGGSGFDLADYRLRIAGVVVDIDGVADDGAPGEGDDVRWDVENIDGGRNDDVLTGSELVTNHLDGGDGSDVVRGLSGNDVLTGGFGADSLIGGLGHDLLEGFDQVSGNDALDGQLGTDTCNSDAGDAETACEA